MIKYMFLGGVVAMSSMASSAAVVFTQDDLEMKISGVIDTGIVSTTHVNSGTQSKTSATDSILGVSNLGFSGTYHFDPDYSAFFNLQAGFNPSKGEQSKEGELFDRNAYIGLNSPYGAVSLGKQWTFNDDWFVGSVFKGGYNSGAIFKLSEFDAVSEIYSKTLKYSSPNLNGWQLGALYSFEDDSSLNTHGQIFSAAAKYSTEQWMIGAAYENHAAQDTDHHYQLSTFASKYNLAAFTARFGMAYADIDGAGQFASIASDLAAQKAWAAEAGIDYLINPKLTLSGDVIYKKNTTFDHQAQIYRVLAIYQIFKPMSLIANVAYLNNADGSSESLVNTDSGLVGGGYANQKQLSTALGVRLSF